MSTIFGLAESEVIEHICRVLPAEISHRDISEAFARCVWGNMAEPGDRVAGWLTRTLGTQLALTAVLDQWTVHDIVRACMAHGQITDESAVSVDIAEGVRRWRSGAVSRDVLSAVMHAGWLGAFLLTPEQEDWPQGLEDLGVYSPVALWGRGVRSAVSDFSHSLGVVGARASTGYGEHVTTEIVSELAQEDIAIVSGAAYGIDGMAHRSALAVEGVTMAFLAGGVDRFYPSGHDALLGRIMTTGVVLAESPCGFSPTKWRFLQRNRLIAAATQATVVVEAGWRSGSLNTANHAASLTRPLGAVPGPVTSAASAGCHRLLREYDAVCVTRAADVRELLPLRAGKER